MEDKCEKVADQISHKYSTAFIEKNQKLIIEVVRGKKGGFASQQHVFDEFYESYLEIGIENEGEYYPNGYLPIWKCKSEWFEKIGYLTNRSLEEIQGDMEAIVLEMIEGL